MWVYIERERTVVECNAVALRQEVCRSLRKIDASSATTKLGQFILWKISSNLPIRMKAEIDDAIYIWPTGL